MQNTFTSSTGGTVTFTLDKQGNRIGLVHKAGNAYSGKIAGQEDKSKTPKKSK